MNKEPDRSQRKALGKGLSALLPNRNRPFEATVVLAPPVDQAVPENFEQFQNIPLHHIEPGQEQPRSEFDDEKLQNLAQSIRAHGIIQPITVRRTDEGKFRIIAGERRWRAARLAGLGEIPALIRSGVEDHSLELALIENIQREDLNPIEVAMAFQKLTSEHRLSHEQIAERTGKDRSTVTNFLRLLKLSEPVRRELAGGTISMGHARALLNLDPPSQTSLCQDVIRFQWSVRQTESFVKKFTEQTSYTQPVKEKKPLTDLPDPNVRAAVEEMAMALGTRVKLVPKEENSGRLEIEYYSQEDLDRIYSVIVG